LPARPPCLRSAPRLLVRQPRPGSQPQRCCQPWTIAQNRRLCLCPPAAVCDRARPDHLMYPASYIIIIIRRTYLTAVAGAPPAPRTAPRAPSNPPAPTVDLDKLAAAIARKLQPAAPAPATPAAPPPAPLAAAPPAPPAAPPASPAAPVAHDAASPPAAHNARSGRRAGGAGGGGRQPATTTDPYDGWTMGMPIHDAVRKAMVSPRFRLRWKLHVVDAGLLLAPDDTGVGSDSLCWLRALCSSYVRCAQSPSSLKPQLERVAATFWEAVQLITGVLAWLRAARPTTMAADQEALFEHLLPLCPTEDNTRLLARTGEGGDGGPAEMTLLAIMLGIPGFRVSLLGQDSASHILALTSYGGAGAPAYETRPLPGADESTAASWPLVISVGTWHFRGAIPATPLPASECRQLPNRRTMMERVTVAIKAACAAASLPVPPIHTPAPVASAFTVPLPSAGAVVDLSTAPSTPTVQDAVITALEAAFAATAPSDTQRQRLLALLGHPTLPAAPATVPAPAPAAASPSAIPQAPPTTAAPARRGRTPTASPGRRLPSPGPATSPVAAAPLPPPTAAPATAAVQPAPAAAVPPTAVPDSPSLASAVAGGGVPPLLTGSPPPLAPLPAAAGGGGTPQRVGSVVLVPTLPTAGGAAPLRAASDVVHVLGAPPPAPVVGVGVAAAGAPALNDSDISLVAAVGALAAAPAADAAAGAGADLDALPSPEPLPAAVAGAALTRDNSVVAYTPPGGAIALLPGAEHRRGATVYATLAPAALAALIAATPTTAAAAPTAAARPPTAPLLPGGAHAVAALAAGALPPPAPLLAALPTPAAAGEHAPPAAPLAAPPVTTAGSGTTSPAPGTAAPSALAGAGAASPATVPSTHASPAPGETLVAALNRRATLRGAAAAPK
jgi:hypothetical protein